MQTSALYLAFGLGRVRMQGGSESMALAVRALLTACLVVSAQSQSYPGLSWPSVPDGSMNGTRSAVGFV